MIGIAGDIRIIADFVVESGGAGAIKEGISKKTSPESDLIQSKSLYCKERERRAGVVSASIRLPKLSIPGAFSFSSIFCLNHDSI